MKKIITTAAILWLAGFAGGAIANAGGFALFDPAHPEIVTGAFTDLKGHTDAGVSLGLITYSEWCPLAIGGSLGRSLGGPSVAIGTSVNLLPVIQAAAWLGIDALWPDSEKFKNLKALIYPAETGTPDIKMSFGPHFIYVFNDGLHGKGMWTLFYGAAWHF